MTVKPQTLVGVGTLATGALFVAGALSIKSDAGYSGVGPNFLPWLVGIALLLCGGWLVYESRTGGYRAMEEPSGADRGHWPGFAWVSVGILANAALITTIGFILSCALCYLLAVQGLRRAAGQPSANSPGTWVVDFLTGVAISAPVFWMFTKFLAISLPGLTATGWI